MWGSVGFMVSFIDGTQKVFFISMFEWTVALSQTPVVPKTMQEPLFQSLRGGAL